MGNSPSKDGSSSSSTLLAPSAAKKADDPDPSRSRRSTKNSLHAFNASISSTNQLDIDNDTNQIIFQDNGVPIDEEISINNTNYKTDNNNNDNNNNHQTNTYTNQENNHYTNDPTSGSPTKHHHPSSSPTKKLDKSLKEETYYDLEIATSLARALTISKASPPIPIRVGSSSSQESQHDKHHNNHSPHPSSTMAKLVASNSNNEFIASSVDSNASCFTNNSLTSSSSATTPTMYKETLYPILENSVESSPIPEDKSTSETGGAASAVESGSPSSLSDSPVFEQEIERKFSSTTKKLSNVSSSSQSSLSNGGTDIDAIIETLVEAGLSRKNPKKFIVSPTDIKFICSKSRDIFLNQPTLLELAAPVKVVGDVHGQFQDLLRIFKLCGFPPNANYLFLGDYVDRGKQSLETIILLLCLKIKYPENFFMLRGNHESASITKMYGFYDECKRRANVKIWKLIVDVFNTLPVAATVADKIFCVHGGLSPHLTNLNQIKNIQRPTDIPESGLLADLLWSDPDSSTSEWTENDRGVSYCFNKKVVSKFCNLFQFDLIARGHMVVEEGYEFFAKRKLVTVFSAPNYCGEFENWGAVMNVDKNLMCSFELLKPNSLLKKK